MKKFRFPFSFSTAASLVVLALLAVTPAVAAEKAPGASEKFELSWTRAVDPEMGFALERLKSLEKRFQAGEVRDEEVAVMRHHIEMMTERAPYRLNLRSNGGSLKEFLAVVSRSSELSLTLINAGEPADLETPLPTFQLRNAHWGAVIAVLQQLLATHGLTLTMVGSDRDNPVDAKAVVCVLRRDRGWADPAAPARQSEFEAFSLADNLSDKLTIDNVTDAIQSAVKLASAESAASLRIKFHPATKMLFVSGSETATHIARQVVASLPKNPVAR